MTKKGRTKAGRKERRRKDRQRGEREGGRKEGKGVKEGKIRVKGAKEESEDEKGGKG